MNLGPKRWLVEGPIEGKVVLLNTPLSFWGGFDATTGRIIDRAHPQHGVSLAGKVVAMPGSRGSSGTPGVLGDSIRRGTGPAALLITTPDINLVAGALAAQTLYSTSCPILQIDHDAMTQLKAGQKVAVKPHADSQETK